MGIPREQQEDSSDHSQDAMRRRVVLLGASNLVRGVSTVLETAQHVWGTPLDVMAACGHGRSYGMTSRVLGRSLPGIAACGLWEDLAQRSPVPTAALVADVGNDILYGAGVSQIATWVEHCLERLASVCRRIVITGLPLDPISTLSPRRFRLIRTLLFPRSQLTFRDALSCARELNTRLAELAVRYESSFVAPSAQWYGWDPIHIRLRHWSSAWSAILSPWSDVEQQQTARGSSLRWLKLRAQRPLYQRMFGIEQRRAQPTCKLRNETIVSLY